MTDLEMTIKCAEAMGKQPIHFDSLPIQVMRDVPTIDEELEPYDPLHDDAEAKELAERFNLAIYRYFDPCEPEVHCKMVRVHPRGKEPWFYPACGDVSGAVNRLLVQFVVSIGT